MTYFNFKTLKAVLLVSCLSINSNWLLCAPGNKNLTFDDFGKPMPGNKMQKCIICGKEGAPYNPVRVFCTGEPVTHCTHFECIKQRSNTPSNKGKCACGKPVLDAVTKYTLDDFKVAVENEKWKVMSAFDKAWWFGGEYKVSLLISGGALALLVGYYVYQKGYFAQKEPEDNFDIDDEIDALRVR